MDCGTGKKPLFCKVAVADELPSDMKSARALRLLQAAMLVLAGWWAFAPALHGGWLWDDAGYLPHNVLLHDSARLWKIWFAPGTFAEYYPLTATVQYLEWSLWGNWTLPYHATSVVLHLIGALLVWRLLERLGLKLAWLGGLVFAVHPLAVESVAWISELKNTLSLALFLPAMLFYLDYDERRQERDYRLALGFFLAAMLAKVTVAPFPFVILLYAWWKRGRIGTGDLRAAAPFLVISIVLVTMTMLAASWNAQVYPLTSAGPSAGGWLAGPVGAGLAIFVFIVRFLWPAGLMPIYPRWLEEGVLPSDFLPWIAVIALLGWLVWRREEVWSRAALLGLGFYLLMLAPVFAFIALNYASMVWALDHLVYLPMIGLIGLAIAALGALAERLTFPLRNAGACVLAVIVVLLAWQTHLYSAIFRSAETLWVDALTQNPRSSVAYDELGAVLQEQGRFTDAMAQYQAAAKLNPLSADPHSNMAHILFVSGHVPEAMAEYALAIKLSPRDALIRYNAGDALAQTGHIADAIAQFQSALMINPDLAEAHYNLGNALAQMGHAPEATQEYETALRLNPDYEEAHANLGNVLLQAGRTGDALSEYGTALQLNPNDADVHANLGVVLMQLGRLPEAEAQFETVLVIDPRNALAQAALARLHAAPAMK
jgi:tetratricopeptide (TPR) repeat protein